MKPISSFKILDDSFKLDVAATPPVKTMDFMFAMDRKDFKRLLGDRICIL
jgi:hypothetical protein